MALTRGIPGVSQLLLRWVPEGREVPDYRRPFAALVLTGQMFAGAFLGIAAQAFLAWASFSMSCPGSASTCSPWPAPSRLSTFRRARRSFSSVSISQRFSEQRQTSVCFVAAGISLSSGLPPGL
jgi:hypothetical protein